MYSAYKLNKQSDNIQPWCTPFPIWNQSVNDPHLEFTVLCPALPLWIRAGSDWPIDYGKSKSTWLPEVRSQKAPQPPPWCLLSLTLGKLNCYTMMHACSSWTCCEQRETEVLTNHQDLLGNHVFKTLRKCLQPQLQLSDDWSPSWHLYITSLKIPSHKSIKPLLNPQPKETTKGNKLLVAVLQHEAEICYVALNQKYSILLNS